MKIVWDYDFLLTHFSIIMKNVAIFFQQINFIVPPTKSHILELKQSKYVNDWSLSIKPIFKGAIQIIHDMKVIF